MAPEGEAENKAAGEVEVGDPQAALLGHQVILQQQVVILPAVEVQVVVAVVEEVVAVKMVVAASLLCIALQRITIFAATVRSIPASSATTVAFALA